MPTPLDTLLARRQRLLGPAYRLFYDEPLHPVRGEGVWLFDAEGRRYLDAYNNVACVGHAHPRVVRAIAEQAARLNTHTRYLHESVLDCAERLLATLPAALGHVMFTCTGSEANDLALRIARTATGAEGLIVTRWAYHGVTESTAEASPSLGAGMRLGARVRTVELPFAAPQPARAVDDKAIIAAGAAAASRAARGQDGVGGTRAGPDTAANVGDRAYGASAPERPYGPNVVARAQGAHAAATAGDRFADSVRAAIADLAAAGLKPAALLVDTSFSSDGIWLDPAGFLAPAVAAVRSAGGLFIADEVQPGFGRTGASFWGFMRHGNDATPLVPDLVTMGKPMGNGHPVAAVAMKPAVLAPFAAQTRYFNTFGGNPVAMAAALAVLDVLRDENLQAQARRVGAGLRRGLADLASRHPSVGAVRGAGLFVGLDLVDPADGKSPAPDLTTRVVDGMRHHGVLLSATGPARCTLKIRPPLVFGDEHAARLVETLDTVLSEVR